MNIKTRIFAISFLLLAVVGFLAFSGCSGRDNPSATGKPSSSPKDSSGELDDRIGALLYDGKTQEALDLLQSFSREDPKNPDIYRLRGTIYLYVGRIDEAIESYDDWMKLEPKNPMAMGLMAFAYLEKDELFKVEKELEKMRELGKKPYLYYLYLGKIAIDREKLPEALGYLDEALRAVPVELSVGKADPRKMLMRYPLAGNIFFRRADIMGIEEKYKEAIEDYSLAIKYNPFNYEVYRHRAEMYEESHRYKKGIEDCNRFLASPGSKSKLDRVYMCRGRNWKELDRMDLGRNDFRKALEINPNNVKALVNLGFDYREYGNPDMGRKYFSKILELAKDPKNDVDIDDIGQAYYVLGKYKKALPYLLKTIEKNPDYPVLYYFAGDCYYHTGDYRNAEKNLNKALEEMEVSPETQVVRNLLKRVKELNKK